ncbi:MAG: NUDIX domain-containing protein [Psychrobium sp.]|nr:NUDIX domain-containing protein [Psychrobium sp.]
MRLLKSASHPDVLPDKGEIFTRLAARGIILNGDNILLLYTARYDDYTLPGGGVDANEDIISALKRELAEEVGACNVSNIKEFGRFEEYRPWYKNDFDTIFMISYCYSCTIDKELASTKLEDYEIRNGMRPLWINIFDAIAHNEKTLKNSNKKGMSIERETFLLKLIAVELIKPAELVNAT